MINPLMKSTSHTKMSVLSHFLLPLSSTHLLKPPNSQFSPPNSTTHFPILTSQHHIFPLKLKRINASFDDVYTNPQSQADSGINFDSILSILELLSLASSAAISSYVALRGGIWGWVGSRVFVWQCVFLVAGVTVGAVIRRRQWRRVSGAGFSRGSADFVEKLEEDLRSTATLIRVSSGHLEKLGVRVRATRKALKEPISQSAGVAQKNSESTRALAAHGDVLSKELGEVQKLLLAMQEQQQKQLELILAIGKAANLYSN